VPQKATRKTWVNSGNGLFKLFFCLLYFHFSIFYNKMLIVKKVKITIKKIQFQAGVVAHAYNPST
jgi:hypothetical protein